MSDFSEPIIGQIGPSVEQEFAAQVISGRRRVEGARRGRVFCIVRHQNQSPADWEGDLTWDMHGVTVLCDANPKGDRHIIWLPYSNIDWVQIEEGS